MQVYNFLSLFTETMDLKWLKYVRGSIMKDFRAF